MVDHFRWYSDDEIIADSIPELKNLTSAEKLQLASELWYEVEGERVVEIPEQIREVLDARMEEYRKDPSTARPWSEVRRGVFDECES